jgi:hypothetical protein
LVLEEVAAVGADELEQVAGEVVLARCAVHDVEGLLRGCSGQCADVAAVDLDLVVVGCAGEGDGLAVGQAEAKQESASRSPAYGPSSLSPN